MQKVAASIGAELGSLAAAVLAVSVEESCTFPYLSCFYPVAGDVLENAREGRYNAE